MSPVISLNLQEAISLKPIEEGPYTATVQECGAVISGPKAHYVPVEVMITDGSDAEGRKFTNRLPIEGPGAGMFIDFVNKCLNLEMDVDDMEELDFDTDDLIGAEVIINIKNEEYPEGSGDFRSNIKSTSRVRAD